MTKTQIELGTYVHPSGHTIQRSQREKCYKVDTFEEGLDHLREITRNCSYSFTFALLMEDKGELFVWERIGMPCLGGEMRTYAKWQFGNCPPLHSDCTRPNDPRPTDLYAPFPDGNPVAVVVPFHGPRNSSTFCDEFHEVMTDPVNSPYACVLEDLELVRDENNHVLGYLLKDTHVDPTVMVHMFRALRNGGPKDLSSIKAALGGQYMYLLPTVIKCIGPTHSNQLFYLYRQNEEVIDRWINKDPRQLSGGFTFYQRGAYNRPEIDYLWASSTTTQKVHPVFAKFPGNTITIDKIAELAKAFAEYYATKGNVNVAA